MAKILEVKNLMGEGWEITIKGKPQEELIAIKEVINCFEDKEKAEKELEKIKKGYCQESFNANREAMGLPPIKPQGILLLAKSNDTMLDVARNVIKAVETTIEVPTGLRSLTVNREQETKDRIQELIGYLNNYVEWR